MRPENERRINELSNYGLVLDPTMLANEQVSVLIDLLKDLKVFSEEQFAEKWDNRLDLLLTEAEEQLNRARLLAALQAIPNEPAPEDNIVD